MMKTVQVLMIFCAMSRFAVAGELPGRSLCEIALRNDEAWPRARPLIGLHVTKIVLVTDFGANPDDGENDLFGIREAISFAIQHASVLSPMRVSFPKGVYVCKASSPALDMEKREWILDLQDARYVEVDGNGSELIIQTPDMGFSRLHESSHVVIRNFSIDYDPLPFTQGVITALDASQGIFDVLIDEGFPAPNAPMFEAYRSWGMLKDPKFPGRLKVGSDSYYPRTRCEPVGDRHFRITLARPEQMHSVAVGDYYAQVCRANNIGRYDASDHITFHQLTVYACSGVIFEGTETSYLNVLNCNVVLRDSRLLVNGADGVHCQASRVGPWVEGCVFEGLSDDCVNLYGTPLYVLERKDSRTVRLSRGHRCRPGDQLVCFNPREGSVLAALTVVSVDEGWIHFDQPVENLMLAPAGTAFSQRGWKNYDHFYNVDASSSGFVIRNNIWRNSRRFGLFIKASNGLIEGNTFSGLFREALFIENEPSWPEGLWSHNLMIRSNVVNECNATGPIISVGFNKMHHTPVARSVHRDMTILENEFHAMSSPALKLYNILNLRLCDNQLAGGDSLEKVDLKYCSDALVSNTVSVSEIRADEMTTSSWTVE
jgi:parallel beta-helix repeat protein